MEPIKIGVGGPVGAGKTMLVEKLTRHLENEIKTQKPDEARRQTTAVIAADNHHPRCLHTLISDECESPICGRSCL